MAYPFLGDLLSDLFGMHIELPIPMFGFMVMIASLVAFSIFAREASRREKAGLLPTQPNAMSKKVPDFAMISMLAGIVGARLFHILEYPTEFARNPIGMIFSRGGFTALGGLIVGIPVGAYYLRKWKLPFIRVADAFAPTIMLGYAIGRLGCQLSGDGDWGIIANMSLKPSWLPNWLWAEQYLNNVIGQKIPPPGVYPTPIYESAAGLAIFFIMWSLRKPLERKTGALISLYLVFAGTERFFVEQIRVNSKYDAFGLKFTQAEAISLSMIVAGIICLLISYRRVRD